MDTRIQMKSVISELERQFSRTWLLWLAVPLIFLPLSATEVPATGCVVRSLNGDEPASVLAARREIASVSPENRAGYEALVAQIEQNRKDLAAEVATAAEVAAQGGLRLSGERAMPVLAVLYDNTPADPFNPVSLEINLFADWLDTTMRAYYTENSYGNFTVTGDVWGFETVSGDDTFYEQGKQGLQGGGALLVAESLPLFDSYVDFAQYDNDGPDGFPNSGDDDGIVDILTLVHPESGAECGSSSNIWSHQNFLSSYGLGPFQTNDNRAGGGKIKIDRYFVAPAFNCDGTTMIDIGIFCHEYGHALGLKDLYDTDDTITGDSDGIGFWGLMGAGNWNSTTSPSHMTAFYKHKLGWLDYFDVITDRQLCLPAVETTGVAARLWTYGQYGSEYFLVENRQRTGFDSALMAPGLVIYHIDEARHDAMSSQNRVNADETRKAIDVETPDATGPGHTVNRDDLDRIETNSNRGDAGDVWCQSGVDDSFDIASSSDPRAMNGIQSIVSVRDIGPCGGASPVRICANFNVGASSPVDLCIEDCAADNCNDIALCDEWWATPSIWVDNNEDQIHDLPASGINNKIWYRLKNLGPDLASGAEVSLYIAPGTAGLVWPGVGELIGTRTIPILEPGQEVEDYFIFAYPDLLDLVGHWCMGIVITHPDDPTSSNSAPLTNNIAQINRQVLVARAGQGAATATADASTGTFGEPDENYPHVQASASGSCFGEFLVESKIYLKDGYNPTGGQRFGQIRIGTPPLFNDALIPPHWRVDFLPGTGPFALTPSGRDSVIVQIWSDTASHGESAHVPLTLWDVNQNVAIGGIVIDAFADCIGPRQIASLNAEWRSIPGDNPDAPNVEVSWNRTLVDEDGNLELLDRYQVYRQINGGIYNLAAEVVVDDDPDQIEFQWYDSVPDSHCPTTYAYKIRAIDAAGNIGAFSPPLVLECQVSSTPSLPVLAGATSRAVPNPFRDQTEIHYELPTDSEVLIAIYDATGQRIRNLAENWESAGMHQIGWDGYDDRGRLVANGIYFYQISHENGVEMKKIVRSR